jgi:large repetitive protein
VPVTITVTGTNDAPIASNASAGTGENTILASSVPAAIDVDGTIAGYALATGPASGSLTFNSNGTYSFNPGSAFDDLAAGATRQVTFTYTATDNDGAVSAPATVTITVTGTNDTPVASSAGAATGENTVLAGSVPAATDVDGTIASYALVTGPASGALTFNSNGTYSFNPGSAFDDLAAGATRQVTFTYTATDNNGAVSAPATVTITVTGSNDLPLVGIANNAVVSEEGLAGANADTSGTSDTTNATTASGTVSINDVDNTTFTVTLTAPTAALTSNGSAIVWSGAGTGTLTGTAGGKTIVSATINNSGAYTVTLSGLIDHATGAGENTLSFSIGVSVSDGLGSSTSSIAVTVEDDSPVIGTPNNGILNNNIGSVLSGDLALDIGADAGSLAKVLFSGTVEAGTGHITSTRYKVSDGTSLGSSYLTYNGEKLVYVSNADGSLTARSVTSNTDVFTVSGNAADGTYKVTMLKSLDDPTYVTSVFGNISGGNGGVYTISDGQTVFQLLLTGHVNGVLDTVNTSANTIGVGSGQDIATGETLRMEFNSSTGTSTLMSGITVTAEGLGNGESLTWTAYDAAGAAIASGTAAGSGGGSGSNVTVVIGPTQLGGKLFDTMAFGASGSGANYKLRLDSITGQSEALDQTIGLQVRGVDGDGDTTTTQALTVKLDSVSPITGTSADEALGGSTGADTLSALDGNDTLVGGGGNDSLSGGNGSDTFKWFLADKGTTATPAADTISDFSVASQASGGDVLDLRDLLQGETTRTSLDNYLDFSSSGGNTVISIKSGGSGGADQTITLTGISNLGSSLGLGSSASDQQIINELINRGKLLTDVTG